MRLASVIRVVSATAFLVALATVDALEAPVACRAFGAKCRSPVLRRLLAAQKACADKFPWRRDLVAFNGLLVRAIGQHACNGVIRTADRRWTLLGNRARKISMRQYAKDVGRFSRFCKDNGVRFMYVQFPKKLDLRGRLLPPGESDMTYSNVDRLLREIRRCGVDALDLREVFSGTAKDVLSNYYRTDHHWTTDASFRAAGMVADEMAGRCGASSSVRESVRRLLTAESWDRSIARKRFLGSLGKRTGTLFSGLDDVVCLRPRFETKMSFYVPSDNMRREGTFEETVMGEWRNDVKDEAALADAYSKLYSGLGFRYPVVIHDNQTAPWNCRVLLIGDSFSRPVEGFLSTVVRRLVAVDPRRLGKSGPVAELVRRERPDIVVQMVSALSFGNRRDADGRAIGGRAMFEYGL